MTQTTVQFDHQIDEPPTRLERLLDWVDKVGQRFGGAIIDGMAAHAIAHYGPPSEAAWHHRTRIDAWQEVETKKVEQWTPPHSSEDIDKFIESLLLD